MPKANHTCKVCGTSYYYCAHCDEAKSGKQGYEPWHVLVHDENCHKIFTTLQSYSMKKITDKEAASILKGCDLSVIQQESIQAQVDTIMANGVKKTKARKSKVIAESPDEVKTETESQDEGKIETEAESELDTEPKSEVKEEIELEQNVPVDDYAPTDAFMNDPE